MNYLTKFYAKNGIRKYFPYKKFKIFVQFFSWNGCLKQIGKKAREKKCSLYVAFIDLEKAYDKVNKEALWQVLRVYDVGGNLFSDIKSIYINSLSCVRVKGGDSECFRINSCVKQKCIMSPWLFNLYMDTVIREVKMGMGRSGMRLEEEEERDWRLPGL